MNDAVPYALILAGGVGSRLWPRSRGHLPKQLLDLTGEQSMLQQTVARIEPLIPLEHIYVMTNSEYVEPVREQLPQLPPEQVVGEPAPRGTAPAIGLGVQHIARREPRAVMFSLHADHFIADEEGFRAAMRAAAAVAAEGWLVNLGVTPTHPETGYGYVELASSLGTFEGIEAHEVRRFVEKPDLERAREYVDSGRYLWNSGIFGWRVDVIAAEFRRLIPDVERVLGRIGARIGEPDAAETLAREWARLERETTIDHGIMEHASRVATVPIDVGWNDVGSWDSLARLLPRDETGNSISGAGDTLILDSSNVFVYSEERFVAVVGVEDLVIVDTGDALLVMPQDRAQEVREIVRRLRDRGRQDLL